MNELICIIIIALSVICLVCVILSIRNKGAVYAVVSVCCLIFIAAAAICGMIPTNENKVDVQQTKDVLYVSSQKNISTENNSKAEKTPEKKESKREEKAEDHSIVYITRTGEKYHYSYDCCGAEFYECTLEEAIERGLEPCGKCVEGR